MGLDPWSLNSNNGQKNFLSLNNEYQSFFQYKSISQNNAIMLCLKKMLQLISPSYFYNSVRTLSFFQNQFITYRYLKQGIYLRLPDGSILYDYSTTHLTENQILKEAETFISGEIYAAEDFNNLDNLKKSELSEIITFLIRSKCNVILYLSPYHPIVYNFLKKSSKYINIFESELFFQELANKNGLIIKLIL